MIFILMANGKTWQKVEILPYKHAIVPYGAIMAGLPSQIGYRCWQKPPLHSFKVVPMLLLNTDDSEQ